MNSRVDSTAEDDLLAAADVGSGRPVVLLPGAAADRQLFVQCGLFDRLVISHRVVALDWRGAGESPAPKVSEYTLNDEVDDVIALLDAKGLEHTSVVGVSHGAAAALALAAAHPERVDALVLCSPWSRPQQTMRQMLHIWRTLFTYGEPQAYGEAMLWWFFSNEFLDAEPQRATAMATAMFVEPGTAGRDQHLATLEMNLGFDIEAQLPHLSQPSLVIAGEYDRVVPASYSQQVAAQLPHARFHLVTGPRSSHAFLAEAGPAPQELIAEFLENLPTCRG